MASKLHEEVKALLQEMYPNALIQEEVPIRVSGRNLRLDLLVDYPFNIAVEVQGKQHDEFVPFFHGDMTGFRDYQRRDRFKETWCWEHSIALVYVYEHEKLTKEILQRKIEQAERLLDQAFEREGEMENIRKRGKARDFERE